MNRGTMGNLVYVRAFEQGRELEAPKKG